MMKQDRRGFLKLVRICFRNWKIDNNPILDSSYLNLRHKLGSFCNKADWWCMCGVQQCRRMTDRTVWETGEMKWFGIPVLLPVLKIELLQGGFHENISVSQMGKFMIGVQFVSHLLYMTFRRIPWKNIYIHPNLYPEHIHPMKHVLPVQQEAASSKFPEVHREEDK